MDKSRSPEILGVELECPACKKLEKAAARVPVGRVIEKLDSLFAKNDLSGAERLIEYWTTEAITLGDLSGELSLVNEMLGLSRRLGNAEKARAAIDRALVLIDLTGMNTSVSGATILLNAATTEKAFGAPDRAVPLYERTADIYKAERLNEKDPKYAALYNNYATTLTDLGQFEKAEALYQKAIALTREAKNLPDCAVTAVNMAHLYEAWESIESQKITDCLAHAEHLLLEECADRTPYFAFVAEKCAPAFDYFGHFFVANQLREIARKIYEGT